MEAVKVQDLAVNDLPWQIEYNAERCTMCGSCVASCTFRAIKVEGGAKFTRKEIDSLGEFVKPYGAKGLAWLKTANGETSSSFAKFLDEETLKKVLTFTDVQDGDALFIVADAKDDTVYASLGALRCEIARRLDVIDPNRYELLWVTDFPLVEFDEEENRYVAKHHPFTAPRDEDIEFLESDPARVRAKAYDIVINGSEAGGGSIRIYSPELQAKMFKTLGFTEERAKEQFGHLIEAFSYGAPPHGGLAFGLDRLVMLLSGASSIRDVIAFPKVQNASELMMASPDVVDEKQLRELCIGIEKAE